MDIRDMYYDQKKMNTLPDDKLKVQAFFNSGLIFRNSNDHQKAIDDFSNAIQIDSKNAILFYHRGLTYLELNQPQKAIQDFDEAIRLDNNFALAYFNRGLTWQKLNRHSLAYQDLSSALKLNVQDKRIEFYFGMANVTLLKYDDAIYHLTRAIALDSKNALAYFNRGIAWQGLNQHQKALDDFTNTTALNRNFAPAYFRKGLTYASLSNYNEAILNFDKADNLGLNLAKIFYYRGLAKEKYNDFSGAIMDFKQYLQLLIDDTSKGDDTKDKNTKQAIKNIQIHIQQLTKKANLLQEPNRPSSPLPFTPLWRVINTGRRRSASEPPKPEQILRNDLIAVSLNIHFSELILEQEIGKGGTAVVLKGKWKGRTVAIKSLTDLNIMMDQASFIEFKNEVYHWNTLHHKNIVQLYGICMDPKHYYMVMEFMPNGSLADLLRKPDPLCWTTRWQIAVDVANALAYLHNIKQSMHRDLKSPNVLLDKQFHAKLSDFADLAKINLTSILQSMNIHGTTRWTAPELLELTKTRLNYTKQADIFSFGILLWELVTRQIPFDHLDRDFDIINAIKTGQRPTIPDECPEVLKYLIPRCWQQDPSHRPEITEIIKLLEDNKKEFQEVVAASDYSHQNLGF
jgi:tetratricopeptide (TPR) repeat protein